jgi:diaminopimelate epimerase
LPGFCNNGLRQIADLALKKKLKQNNRFGYSAFAGMSGIISLTLHSRAVVAQGVFG